MTRRRLDLEIVRRGLAATRAEARAAIESGRVNVGGRPSAKASTLVAPNESVAIEGAARPYASRGGEKLAGALDRLDVDPSGRRCLDVGASTGGFTDVLLSRGAEHVVAVDVGYGQLAWTLRNDPRVTLLERTNARSLGPDDLPYRPDLVTADVSFISLTKIIPAIAALLAPGADAVLLVKPQFEAGRDQAGRGVVTDPGVWRQTLTAVAQACEGSNLGSLAVVPSRLTGPAGNVEFFLHAREGEAGRDPDLDAAVDEAGTIRGRAS
ncbi:MAG: TlyA family RNA methyltransferase [Actinomycetota bacterium]|nr:TlyA family RNA methyltransferase [Actinomycetota bacterium]